MLTSSVGPTTQLKHLPDFDRLDAAVIIYRYYIVMMRHPRDEEDTSRFSARAVTDVLNIFSLNCDKNRDKVFNRLGYHINCPEKLYERVTQDKTFRHDAEKLAEAWSEKFREYLRQRRLEV